MENITFNMSNIHKHGSAFYDYLALRKQFFVDTLNWKIPHDADVEMDQYDNPMARYSLVLDDSGRVIGGARTMSTMAKWGDHTYMLKDAMTGKLGTIPANLLPGIVESPKVWEGTRLVIAPEVNSTRARMACLDLIMTGLVELAVDEGAEQMMSLTNLWVPRALNKLGYDAEFLGKPYENGDDGHKYAVIGIPTRHKPVEHLTAA